MRKRTKVTLSLLVIGVLGSLSAVGVYGLFTGKTQNTGNELTSGTVSFTDNDSGAALYNVTGLRPGDVTTKCIKGTYSGSLPATVHIYGPNAPGPLAPYIDLVITPGTQTASAFPSCTGFTPDAAGAIYSGTLQSFEQTRNSYAAGIATAPAGQSSWSTNSSVVYRFQATLQAATPDTTQGWTSGVHSFVWEARSQ